MKITVLVARILLGLLFAFAGSFAFIPFTPPPQPGLAGQFQDAFWATHWVKFIDVFELISGLLLLTNRYVPLALITLAGILANILFFHIALQPQTLPIPLVAVVLWFLIAWQHRASFVPLLAAKPPVADAPTPVLTSSR
jgi:putative oxidoreductase